MTPQSENSGYFRCGLPYNRAGSGPRPLVVFPGLTFENKPQFGMLSMYGFLRPEYTLFAVQRRPGIPAGYSLALHFAAVHLDPVRRLVIHSSAHALNDGARALQLDVARLAQMGRWRMAFSALIRTVFPQRGLGMLLAQPLVWRSASLLSLKPPRDPGDLAATVEAEDKHAFKDRLYEIAAPTMVAGGADDFFYSPTLFRETAAGIPNARLCLYADAGHPAGGGRFRSDVLAFLRENGEGSDQ